MKNLKKGLLAVLLILSIALGLGTASANALTLRFAHVGTHGSLMFLVGEKLKENIETLSQGEIKVDVFPAGQLGNLPQMVGQVKKGSIDLFKDHVGLSMIIKGGKDFGVIFAPYLFRDQEHLHKFIASPLFKDMMGKVEQENGIKCLGLIMDRAPRALTTRHKMALVPDDLKGLKIRAPKAPSIFQVFKIWGASPTVVAAPEMYNALKQKVVDGQDNGIDVVADWKLYEVQNYYTAIDYSRSAEVLWVNQQKWDSLSATHKEVIQKATERTAEWATQGLMSKILGSYWLAQERGMTIVMPPLKPWIDSSRKVLEELEGKMWSEGLYAKIQGIK